MYLQHFSLSEKPFSLTPDTQLFLRSKSHQEALNTILLALKYSEGFIKIVGEVGTGKTMLCRILLSILNKRDIVTAYVPNPWINPDEIKAFIAKEIGANYDENMPAHELTSSIYERLLTLAGEKKQVILIVDETQTMPRETIEALRLLTNLETEKRKLLQVVIFGQPELDKMLKRSDLRQLKQRIVFSEYLKPLNFHDFKSYVRHRLRVCGAKNEALFSRTSLLLIYLASAGIPRLINILCHKSMMVAYGRGDRSIGVFHVTKAISDTSESHWFGKFVTLRWQFTWLAVFAASVVANYSEVTTGLSKIF